MAKNCKSCEFEVDLRHAKDGETIALREKCVECDYRVCNCNIKEAV